MDIKAFLKTRTATALLGIILVFVMVFTARILVQQHRINREISKLQAQADKIKKDNSQLSSLIDYLKTPQYEERQAREKLNLKKEGEIVLSLPLSSEEAGDQLGQQRQSNVQLWFNYFFNSSK